MRSVRDSGLTDTKSQQTASRSQTRALIATVVIVFALLLTASTLKPKPSEAYPTFAQAIGVKCSMCHTMVPELNAYGRYLQRTFYAPIGNQTMKDTLPVWFWLQSIGNSKGGLSKAQPNAKDIPYGADYIYFVGFAGPDLTYRVENTFISDDVFTNQASGPETSWLAYHAGYLHLQAGVDYPGPVPAFLANPSDYEAAFALRHLAIGKHSYNLINRRLTFRADYEKGPIDVEVAWRGGTNSPLSFGSPSDFSIQPGTDRAFPQWKVAYAPPGKPYEFGDFGILGTYVGTLKPTKIDHYWDNAPYFQLDPGFAFKGSPGVMAYYAWGHDSNPSIAVFPPGGPTYHAGALELMEPIFKGAAVLNVRKEVVDTGLARAPESYVLAGTSIEPFPVSFPYVFARFDIPMGGYSSAGLGRPTYQWALQFEGPLQGPWASPSTRRTVQVAQAGEPPPDGAALYGRNCQACHQANGQGEPPGFPSLAGDAMVTAADATALTIVVKKGTGIMPAYEARLNDAEIAALLTYIRSSWGNSAGAVGTDDVAAVK